MSPIAEALFIALGFVIGGGIIIGLVIAIDERKQYDRELARLDKEDEIL